MADVTLIAGNPASRIREQYSHLMSIGCPNELKSEALRIVAAGGISEKNAAKFRTVVAKETRLPRLQQYLTNFMLSAGGDGVLDVGPKSR